MHRADYVKNKKNKEKMLSTTWVHSSMIITGFDISQKIMMLIPATEYKDYIQISVCYEVDSSIV